MKFNLSTNFLLLFGAILVMYACSSDDDAGSSGSNFSTINANVSLGEITVVDAGSYRVHGYSANISAEVASRYSAYIIEGQNEVFLLDVAATPALGSDIKTYVDAIGKPVERIIISHAHPDHYGGLSAFDGVDVYAIESVKNTIEAGIPAFGTPAVGVDVKLLALGNLTIDGIEMSISSVKGAESDENIVMDFGSTSGVVFVNDLAYNGEHLFMATGSVTIWKSELETLKQNYEGYDHVLVGHGGKADGGIFANNITYLEKVMELQESSANFNEFFAGMTAAYPSYSTAGVVGLSFSGYWGNVLEVPTSVEINDNQAYMEGLAVYGTTDVYTTNFINGEIRKTNFKTGDVTIIQAAPAAGASGWGLRIDEANNVLLACINAPFAQVQNFFGTFTPVEVPGKVLAIDLTSGDVVEEWMLAAGTIGNALDVDGDGNIYISDVAGSRTLKITRATGEVSVWVQGVPGGGCVYDDAGNIYVHSNDLVKIPINADGSAGQPDTLSLTGVALSQGDGLAFAGNNTFYTTIDGTSVGKIVIDGNGGGTVETILPASEGLGLTSITVMTAGFKSYLLGNDGQLFGLLGGGQPNLPFKVAIRELQ